ncbi:PilZ domain-containing protein [Thiococcus pfennigii]|jgi:hypothetical protein|uniref:PilZ domain-containing protein n=1 Tax=Thiococcus pfennigii TaxID=1057 RepID=UPI0019077AFE|nr:PilZ domain-containing protein [Thiococcus pfennigii]MBK1699937.1 hypothetical protein [Thiococcus pfennigii]MBK1730943.1 hypothetical protein [Thiococcus pfennigii]
MTRAANGGKTPNRRRHSRLPMEIPVRLVAEDMGGSLLVENRDISWGGVQFIVARGALTRPKTVTLTFPWAKGDQFVVRADIVRIEPLDDGRDLVAARFASLSAADQQRLEKLLRMLDGANRLSGGEGVELVPTLEVLFNDPADMSSKLNEIAAGRLSLTVFKAYQVHQSIRLVLAGIARLPAVRLRARVAGVRPLAPETAPDWDVYEVELSFEHPAEELQRIVASFIERLSRIESSSTTDWSFSADHSVDLG